MHLNIDIPWKSENNLRENYLRRSKLINAQKASHRRYNLPSHNLVIRFTPLIKQNLEQNYCKLKSQVFTKIKLK